MTTNYFHLFTLNLFFSRFSNFAVVSRPDFLFFLQLLINLRIQADILKVLCKSNLCSIKSKSFSIATVVKTIVLCSFEILTSFSDSSDGFMSGYLSQLSLTCKQEGPFHQISGILVSKLPLLPKPARLSLVGTYCQLISSLCETLLTLFRMNWL